MTSFNFCSSFFGVTGVTSLEFLSSVHGATEVTSLKFRSFQFVWGVWGELAQIFSSLYGATGVTALAICASLVYSYWSDLAFFSCHLQDLETLSSKVDTLQNQIATNSVEYALVTVRQFAGRPFPLIDNHSLLAALEQLADVARQTGHAEKKKYYAIFRQSKPLLRDGRLASVVRRLLGDPEEKQIASQIQKILKSGTAESASPSRSPRYPYTPPGYGYPRPLLDSARDKGLSGRRFNPQRNRCFQCGNLGHFARNCPGRFS